MPICENCGTGLPVGYEYCYQCGHPVRALPPEQAVPGIMPPFPPPGVPDERGAAAAAAPLAVPDVVQPGAGQASALVSAQALATWGTRLAAAVIDYLIVSVVVLVPALIVLSNRWGGEQNVIARFRNDSASGTVLALELGLFGAFFAYNLVCEAAFQATLGKRLLNLRVVGYGGGRPGLPALLVRNATKTVSCSVPLVNAVVGVPLAMIVIAVSHDRQRIGDMLAHTYVLRDVVTLVVPGTPR